MTNSRLHRQRGFTILELIVVVSILGLMASLATDYVVTDTNKERRGASVNRIHQIQYAIAGDHSRTLNKQPAFSGYIADTGSVPKYVRDLLSNAYCTNVRYRARESCVAAEHEWREANNWKGPYLQPTGYKDVHDGEGALLATIPIFRDGWGNRQQDDGESVASTDNLDFGWVFDVGNGGVVVRVASLGANGSDADVPGSEYYAFDRDIVREIHANQVAGSDIDVSIVNHSGRPDGLFCLKAIYVDGSSTFVDLGARTTVPAARTFGEVTLKGFVKPAISSSCEAAAKYTGIRETHHFAHNAFNTGELELVIN